MTVYLRAKKLDMESGKSLIILLHNEHAEDEGIKEGQKVMLMYRDVELYVDVEQTETGIGYGEVGIYEDIWSKYEIPTGEFVSVTLFDYPKSIRHIKKKLLGEKLNAKQIAEVIDDISKRKLTSTEVAYFMSTFFNPGFDDGEIINIAKSMAESGDTMTFSEADRKMSVSGDGHEGGKDGWESESGDMKDNDDQKMKVGRVMEGKSEVNSFERDGKSERQLKLVVDKHSIGGIAAKGITPILVSIIATFDELLIPNTSTRAITSPAGTSDILEVVMPIDLTLKKMKETVLSVGGSLVWGGSLNLAPADDVMIAVERAIHIQSYNKLIASIVAKKIAVGVKKIVIDIPYGRGAKVDNSENAQLLGRKFERIFEEVGIESKAVLRFVKSPDGRGVGPALEMRDILRVLEQKDNRPLFLEEEALKMTGALLELVGMTKKDLGTELARQVLESGKALAKFWEIAKAQGAKKQFKAEDIELDDHSYDVVSKRDGSVKFIDNKEVRSICSTLGTPFIQRSGMYFHKHLGDEVKKGERVITLYGSSQERIDESLKVLDMMKLMEIK